MLSAPSGKLIINTCITSRRTNHANKGKEKREREKSTSKTSKITEHQPEYSTLNFTIKFKSPIRSLHQRKQCNRRSR